MEQPSREKQSELREVHLEFQDSEKRLSELLTNLQIIGNSLHDESNSEVKGNDSQLLSNPSPRLPGIVSDLYNDSSGFKILISQIEGQVSKIKRFV